MSDFISRMKVEAQELQTKFEGAEKGLANIPMSGLEQILLRSQIGAMKAYLEILNARIQFYEKG